MFPEQIRQSRLPVGEKQIVRRAFQIAKRLDEALPEFLILDDGILGEGQCIISRLSCFFGRKIKHTVAQAFIGACAAIVNFVRMQHDYPSGRAEMRFPPIGKSLDAGKRDTQRIGIMTVRRIGVAMKARFDALYAFAGGCLHDPFEFARTFKIADAPRR